MRSTHVHPQRSDPTIDLLTFNKEKEEYILHLIEPGGWRHPAERCKELAAKINQYVQYVTEGRLTEEYPDAEEKGICFRLDCARIPDGEVLELLDDTEALLDGLGIRLSVRVLN